MMSKLPIYRSVEKPPPPMIWVEVVSGKNEPVELVEHSNGRVSLVVPIPREIGHHFEGFEGPFTIDPSDDRGGA